jgi:hypothetical protein
MSAITFPVKLSPVEIPSRLYATATAPAVSGMWSVFGAFVRSISFKGASEQAKSAVLSCRAVIPLSLLLVMELERWLLNRLEKHWLQVVKNKDNLTLLKQLLLLRLLQP